MSDRALKAAYAAAVVLVTATVIVLALTRAHGHRRPRATAATPVVSPAPAEIQAEIQQRQQQQIDRQAAAQGQPARHAATVPDALLHTRVKTPPLRVARAFMGAYLRYDVGQVDSKVRETFNQTATPALAHRLLSAPPSIPPTLSHQARAVPRERLGFLDGQLSRDGRRMTATATVLSGPDASSLELRLAWKGSRWLIVELVV